MRESEESYQKAVSKVNFKKSQSLICNISAVYFMDFHVIHMSRSLIVSELLVKKNPEIIDTNYPCYGDAVLYK